MPLLDADGCEIATDRCDCGRHKRVEKPFCCDWCVADPGLVGLPPGHSTGCNIVQESFPDTRRGVVQTATPGHTIYLRIGQRG